MRAKCKIKNHMGKNINWFKREIERKKPNISQKNSKQKLKNKRKWIKYKIEKNKKNSISMLKNEIENKGLKTKKK